MSNTYANDEFWAAYAAYVDEVAPLHQRAIEHLLRSQQCRIGSCLLDLGCGRINEAARLFVMDTYIDIDADPANNPAHEPVDYRDMTALTRVLRRCSRPDAFCSLFSTELTAPASTNNDYYQQLFDTFPTLQRGIVSGFYYDDSRRNDPVVEEAGGLRSFQSIGLLADDRFCSFTETRLQLRVPSKLFGRDVVEVWRLLERKP